MLSFALKSEKIEAVCALIRSGVDVNSAIAGGITPLFVALLTGNLALMKMLIEAGAIVDNPNPYGTTVLLKVHIN